jgi:ribosomal protein S8
LSFAAKYLGKNRLFDKRISKVVEAPGFIRGINPKSKIENPQARAFIRGVNRKSKIENRKSIDPPCV